MKYRAEYLPATAGPDPSRGGFDTEDAAWEYIGTCICNSCQTEVRDGKESIRSTGCGCEWLVGEEDKINAARDFEELLEAGGMKEVWPPKDPLQEIDERIEELKKLKKDKL